MTTIRSDLTPSAPTRRGTRPRLEGADFLRALATLAVIATHAVHWPHQSSGVEQRVWLDVDQLTRFCVPAFVVLSGVVLAYRYGDQPLGAGFMRRRLRRSLLPWIVWAPVYFAINMAFNEGVGHDPRSIATWFAMGGGHLYFLLIIPQLYVVYLFWPRRRAWAPWLATGALIVQTALCVWRLYGAVRPGLAALVSLTAGYELFPFWIGYFAVGLWLGMRYGERRPDAQRWVAIGAAALFPVTAAVLLTLATVGSSRPDYGGGTGAYLLPLMPPMVFSVCIAALWGGGALMQRSRLLERCVTVISTYSLGIYIVHPMLMRLPGRLMAHALVFGHLPDTILPTVALVPSSLLLALALVLGLARTPLAVTLGVSPNSR